MRSEGLVASPAFTTAHDGDCANCGAHIPAGATAGMVDDDLWCQPCRCELAAKQEALSPERAAFATERTYRAQFPNHST